MTPNYVDSSLTGIVVSPWCSCRGSGNMEEECEKFLRDFTENPCLRKSCSVLPAPGALTPLVSQRGPRGLPEPCASVSVGMASDPCRASAKWMLPPVTLVLCPWRVTPELSVGQPQLTPGGIEPVSSQARRFLLCYPASLSQVPLGTALW